MNVYSVVILKSPNSPRDANPVRFDMDLADAKAYARTRAYSCIRLQPMVNKPEPEAA